MINFVAVLKELPHTEKTYTEPEIVALLKAKDSKVFSCLYEKYSGALYHIIVQIITDKELANDLLQEVFITIWDKAESYDSTKGRLFTWMLKIARNTTIDMLRSKSYRSYLKVAGGNANIESAMVETLKPNTPDDLDNAGLAHAVQLLSPQFRRLIELVYFEGYTQAEVAAMQHTPLGTVKTRMRAALNKLREVVVDHPANDEPIKMENENHVIRRKHVK